MRRLDSWFNSVTDRLEIPNTLPCWTSGLRSNQTLLLEYEARADKYTADSSENDSDGLIPLQRQNCSKQQESAAEVKTTTDFEVRRRS